MIVIVGAGGMGSVIAGDLSRNHDVVVIDNNPGALDKIHGMKTFQGSVSDFPGTEEAELFVTALPSEAAYDVMKHLLRKGRDVVDISFTDYNPFDLNSLAKENNAVYVPHAGFAPGLSNILAGWLYYAENSRDIEILVGGLQEKPIPPMDYIPTFNASSVIDEYTRPARYIRNGEVKSAEPLETLEKVTFGDLGQLETFYSDGLATILDTLGGATVIEKTLRYPGHLDKMKFLRDMGYFNSEIIDGCSPREVSNAIFRNLVKEYRDISILQVRSNDAESTLFQCVDHYDQKNRITSMGRMTGYSAAAIAEGVLKGMVEEPGVFATEWIGKSREFFDTVLGHLAEHSIRIERKKQ